MPSSIIPFPLIGRPLAQITKPLTKLAKSRAKAANVAFIEDHKKPLIWDNELVRKATANLLKRAERGELVGMFVVLHDINGSWDVSSSGVFNYVDDALLEAMSQGSQFMHTHIARKKVDAVYAAKYPPETPDR